MANTFLSYVSDEHLLRCIEGLHNAYVKAKKGINKKKFYSNKVDTLKLTFDAKFNGLAEEEIIRSEVLRQIDKSINNSIGTFHEELLGGIEGYERGNLSGYDVKALDNTLFADIKNKHNTMNSSSAESLFRKLAEYADRYRSEQAKCYWVQILAKDSFCEKWEGIINGREYSHSRVFKISGDKFYELLTGEANAFFNLYKVLPEAIDYYLRQVEEKKNDTQSSVLDEIQQASVEEQRSVIDQVTFENFPYYQGFSDL